MGFIQRCVLLQKSESALGSFQGKHAEGQKYILITILCPIEFNTDRQMFTTLFAESLHRPGKIASYCSVLGGADTLLDCGVEIQHAATRLGWCFAQQEQRNVLPRSCFHVSACREEGTVWKRDVQWNQEEVSFFRPLSWRLLKGVVWNGPLLIEHRLNGDPFWIKIYRVQSFLPYFPFQRNLT